MSVCLTFMLRVFLGLYVYVNPVAETMVIRLGKKYDIAYILIMKKIAKVLGEED